MPAWIALGVGVSSLIGTSISVWMSHNASEDAKKEARRAEKLRIHFAKEETEREQRKFRIQTGLQKEQLAESKKNNRFERIQKFLDNINDMQTNNVNNTLNIANSLRQRRRA